MSNLPDISQKGKDSPRPTTKAREFLLVELRAVDFELNKCIRCIAETPLTNQWTISGYRELMKVHTQKKAILQELMAMSKREYLPVLLRRRLTAAWDHLNQLQNAGSETTDQVRQANIQKEILSDLAGKWLIWLNQYKL